MAVNLALSKQKGILYDFCGVHTSRGISDISLFCKVLASGQRA